MIYESIKSTQSLDISWLPEKISYKMQLNKVEADLEDQGDIIADLKDDVFVETRAQAASLAKKVDALEKFIKQQFKKAENERQAMVKLGFRKFTPPISDSDGTTHKNSERLPFSEFEIPVHF